VNIQFESHYLAPASRPVSIAHEHEIGFDGLDDYDDEEDDGYDELLALQELTDDILAYDGPDEADFDGFALAGDAAGYVTIEGAASQV
jgi:hypothetical protein